MPQITLTEDFKGGLRSTFALLMSSSLFEEFHNTVQKHRDARGAEFEDFGKQRMKRRVTYVIPEHGVLKLLKQGDTFVTQEDVALFDESGDKVEVVSVSVSEGGELAKSVYLKAYWDIRAKSPPEEGTSLELSIEYSFSAPRLVRSLVEKGLKGEITNRHTKMITFLSEKDAEIPIASRYFSFPGDEPKRGSVKPTTTSPSSPDRESSPSPTAATAPADGVFFSLIEDDNQYSCRESIASALKNSMRLEDAQWSSDAVRGSWGGFTFKSCIDDDDLPPITASDIEIEEPKKKRIHRRPPQLHSASEKTKLLRSDSPEVAIVPCWRRCFS